MALPRFVSLGSRKFNLIYCLYFLQKKPSMKEGNPFYFYDIIFKPLHTFMLIFVNHEEESHFDPVCIGI